MMTWERGWAIKTPIQNTSTLQDTSISTFPAVQSILVSTTTLTLSLVFVSLPLLRTPINGIDQLKSRIEIQVVHNSSPSFASRTCRRRDQVALRILPFLLHELPLSLRHLRIDVHTLPSLLPRQLQLDQLGVPVRARYFPPKPNHYTLLQPNSVSRPHRPLRPVGSTGSSTDQRKVENWRKRWN
jgi:hypothetical protein